jgi:dipeptidyl aminopeptidase/acylaminoacyl peptidase
MTTLMTNVPPLKHTRIRQCAIGVLTIALLAGCSTQPLPATTAVSSAVSPQTVKRYDVRDFFSSPEQAYFRLSEDGKTLSYMRPAKDLEGKRRNIYVQPLDGSKLVGGERRLTQETARDIDNYFWKGSNTLLYQKDFGGDENFHVVSVDVASGAVKDLTPYDKTRASVLDSLRDDPEHVLITHNQRDAQVFDVYRVNVRTGAQTLVAQNPGNVTEWTTDHAGKVRIGTVSDGVNMTLLYRAKESDAFKPIITTNYRTEIAPQFFTADNLSIYAMSNRGRDKKALVIIDPSKPDLEKPVHERNDVDLWSASWSDHKQRLDWAEYITDKLGREFFEPEAKAMFEALQKQLPGMEITLQSATKTEDKFIVAASSDRTEGARYVYDRKSNSLTQLAVINPKITPSDMAAMKPISYKSRDGLTINGYLTLPVNKPAKNLACVVNPHGGPWARDAWGFSPEVQFLANRGYCVLQMNFRGSTGYGRAFWEASFKQWGKAMQNDITDGVQWLVAQGIADPKRVGIYGGSYGGYATLAGVTFTPDLYAAAVDYVGVANLLTFMSTIPPYWEPERQRMYDMVGHPEKELELMKAASPVFHVDNIKTPLFVAQGAKDPRVNKAESDQVVEALKKRGITVDYMVKDNEGHGFRNQENQFEFYSAMEKFFAQHLRP